MTHKPKPEFLPEQPAKSTQPTAKVITKRNRKVEAGLWVSLLMSVGALGLIGHIVQNEPDRLGLQTFEDAQQTALAFDGTHVALGQTAVLLGDEAFNNNQTAAALDAHNALIDQRETQSAQNQIATETSIAIVNAQQATRAAIDFYSTQVAHEQEATQVQLNYQGTQAAISRDATAIALGFLTQTSPQNQNTAIPTLERRPFFEETFTSGVSESHWHLSHINDWQPAVDGAVVAVRDGAWMLTQLDTLSSYTLALDLTPVAGTITDFYIIINLPNDRSGLALRLSYNGTRLTTAGLYQFERAQLDGNGLFSHSLGTTALYTAQLPDLGVFSTLPLELSVQDTLFTMRLNGQDLLATSFSRPLADGAIGLQLSAGTTVNGVAIYD